MVALPRPDVTGSLPLEQTLKRRRSVRGYSTAALTLAQVGQLLWAGQGITDTDGGRTAPSAGALYPLELYLVAGKVEGLAPGVYRYRPRDHRLARVRAGDHRPALSEAALGQESPKDGAAVIVITAVYARTTKKYGDRGIRYVHMEVGFAAENVLLQSAEMGFGSVFIGAFHDGQVRDVLGLPADEAPLGLIPLGRRR